MLTNISPDLIKAYQEEIAKRGSPATLKRKTASLSKFFDWAKDEGHIPQNPIAKSETIYQTPTKKTETRKNNKKYFAFASLTLGIIALILALKNIRFPIPSKKSSAETSTQYTSTNIQAPTILSPWTIYAKYSLKDSEGVPTNQGQLITFSLYKTPNDLTPLWTSEAKQVTPDTEGDISITLDDVPSDIFFQNERLYLGGTASSSLGESQKLPVIPVASANTAVSLQGYVPASPEEGAYAGTIPVISEDGSLLLASESPAVKANEGNLLVEGQAVTIQTPVGSNGNITINPDKSLDVLSKIYVQEANLSSGSLISGYVGNNLSNYDLLTLSSGSKATEKFSVDSQGNTFIAGNEEVDGKLTVNGIDNSLGYNQTSGNFTVNQVGGETASVIKKGTALSDLMTLTLDERNKPIDRNSIYSTLVLKRYDGAREAAALYVDEGNAIFDGQIQLGRFATNPTAIGQASIIYNTTDSSVYYWNGSSWVSVGTASTVPFSGILSGTNTTAAMVVGSGASLITSGTGTITATELTCTGCVANSELANSSLTINSTGILTGGGSVSLGGSLTLTATEADTLDSVTTRGSTTVNTITAGNIIDSGLTASKGVFTDISKQLTSTGTLGADQGGTGISSYTVGDILYASGITTLSPLSDVATGNALISGGLGTAPSWGKITLGTHTTGNYVSSIAGTTNQIDASAATGDVTLSIPSDFRAPGTVNAVNGIYTGATAGTQRIDASGNLVNIGNITGTGDIVIDAAGGDVNLGASDNLEITASTNLIFGGVTSLGEVTAANDSGAYLVGAFDEFDNSTSSNVQAVLNDLDAAITAAASPTAWSAITSPSGDLTLTMAAYNTVFNWDPGADSAETNFSLTTQGEDTIAGGDESQILLSLSQTSNGVDVDQAADALLSLSNADVNDPVGAGILFGTGSFTNYIDTPSSVFKVDGSGNVTGVAGTFSGNLIVQGTTGLTFNTGVGGDITFAYGEKIDNDTDGTITLTAATTNLSGNLDVNGSTNDIAGTLNLSGNSLTSTGALTVTPGAGTNLNIALSTTGDFTVNTDDLYVDTSSGFVGMGTSAPLSVLDIAGLTGVDALTISGAGAKKFAANWSTNAVSFDIFSPEPDNKLLNTGFESDLTSWSEVPSYTLNDQFTTDRAAGAVNGTSAEPTGGTRTVVDTESKLSISSSQLTFSGGKTSPAWGDPGLWYPSVTRSAGKMLVGKLNFSDITADKRMVFGFSDTTSGIGTGGKIVGLNIVRTATGGIAIASGDFQVGTIVVSTDYQIALVLKGAGAYYYIKGGTQYPNWTLLWIGLTDSTTPLYPYVINNTAVFTADNIRIPTSTWLPTPLAYDTFTRGDGAIGSSETTGPDSQTTPSLAWTGGTIATNKNVIVPTLGSELVTNGTFDTDTNWTKGAGWDINSTTPGKAHGANTSGTLTSTGVTGLAVGNWFLSQYTISGYSGSGIIRFSPDRNTPGGYKSANGTYYFSSRTGYPNDYPSFNSSAFTGDIDDVSVKALTLSSLFSTVSTSDADVIADANVTLTAGTQAGLVLNLDSTSSPANFIIVYHDGTSVKVDEAVAGVYTNKQTTTVTYSAGATLRAIREGTKLRVYYNNALVGSELTMTANTNTKHGLFSTYSGNSFDNFTLWARGSGTTKYTTAPFEELTATRDTGTKYAGTASAKLVAGGTDANYLQSLNVGDTSTYTLTAYAYTDGGAVTTTDLDLYYDGALLATTFAYSGTAGWYRLTGTVTGVASAKDFGVRVHAGKTVYIDSMGVQSGTGSDTTLNIADSGTGMASINVENFVQTGGTSRLDSNGNLLDIATTEFNGVTYTWPGAATANYVLQSGGTGASSTLSWVDPNAAVASSIYWTQALGALYPKNSTVDMLVGGTATASAKFAVTGMDSGTPTATISGTTANVATYLTGEGNLATTNMAPLTLGGVTTGDINFFSTSNKITSAGDLTIAGDITVTGSDITLGAAGVKLTGDGDGAITFLGLGDGFDEDLTLNLDDTENVGTFTSSTGLTTLNFSGISLQESGINVLNNDEIDASSELLTIMDDETGTGVLVFATSPTFTTDITTPSILSAADLTINPTGGQVILADTATLNIGGLSGYAYNSFASGTDAKDEAAIAADNDVYIGGDLEVDGTLYAANVTATALAWDDLTAPTADLTLNHSTYNTTFDSGATTGTFFTYNADSLTSGKALALVSDSAAVSTAFTGDLTSISYSPTYTGGVGLDTTGNLLDISRSITLNNLGNTLTVSGAVATISDSGTQTSGTLTSTADVLRIAQNYTSNTGSALNVTSGGGATGFALRVNDDGTFTDTTPFVVDNSGNVGIGTTGPAVKLDVSATGNAGYFHNTDANSATLIVRNYGGVNSYGFYDDTSAYTYIKGSVGIGALSFSSLLDVSGTAQLRGSSGGTGLYVNSSGNVGIGTTGPDAKLDSLATTEQLRLTYTDGTVYSAHTVDSSGNLTIDNTGTKTIIADDLQINGGDILDSNGNESIRFGTTASAVNETTLTNAATGGTVLFAATGGDTDVALSIDSKGADALNLNGTATGDVNIAGGYGGTGCTITNSNGNLSCNGTITGTIAGTIPWSEIDVPTANLSLAHAGYTTAFTFDSVTTADAFSLSSSSLTTGTILDLSSTSTAGGASGLSKVLDITRSGTNANASHTAYGLYSAVTNTGTTSTNIGGYFSASGATNNYGLIVENGNVGIGTTGPGYALDVNGVIKSNNTLRVDSATPSILLTRTNSTTAYGVINFRGSDGVTDWQIATNNIAGQGLEFNEGSTNRLYIQPSGNIGIGTTGPDAKLDSLATTEQLRLTYTDGTVYTGFTVDSGGDLSIDATGGDVTLASGDNLNLTAAGDLIFGGTTSLAETTAANDSGAYLVGTFDEFDYSNSTNVQGVLNDIDSTIAGIIAGTSGIWTDGGTVTYLTSTADDLAVGGTTLAASMFGIDESAGNFYFGYDNSANPTLNFEATDADAGEFGFNTNDSFYFSNANVGVGTTAPDAKLEINHATGDVLRLTYNDSDGSATNYTDFSLDSTGGLVLTGSAASIASGIGADKNYLTLTPATTTLTGTTQVTSLMDTYLVNRGTIAGDTATVTVDDAATLVIAGPPAEGTNVSLTEAYGLKVNSAATTATTAYGLFVDAPTGAGSNYAAIFASGNVGIGTSAPTSALEVTGNIQLTSIGNQLTFVDDGYIKSSANNTIELQSGGTLDFKIADRIPAKFQYTDVFFYAGAVFNEDSADYDFRVEGNGDANLIFADAGVDKVGIGTNGPDAKLDSLSTTEQLRLTYADGTVYSSFTVDLNGDLTIAPTGGDVALTSDLAVNGATSADISSTTTTATIFNTTVTTLSLGGAATTLNIGTTDSVIRAINIGTGTGVDTIHIGDGATGADVITIGSANAGNVTVQSNATLNLTGSTNSVIDFPNFDVATTGTITTAGDLAVNGGDVTTTATTLNVDVGNTGTINFRDGTNILSAVKDQGDYVYWNLKGKSDTGNPATCSEGDIYYNAFDDTVSVCHAGNTWEQLDGGGGGSSVWSALTDPTGNLSLAMAEYTTAFAWNTADTAAALDAFSLSLTNDATTDSNTQRLLVLQNNDAAGSTATERLLTLNNADTTEAVTTAFEVLSEAGTITTAIDVSDAEIGTAISTGANDLTGTNWSITGSTGAISTSSTLNVDSTSTLNGATLDANADLTFTSGTGSLIINSSLSNASDQVIDISPAFAGGATDALTYTVMDIAAFSPTNGAGTDLVNGIEIGALTDPGATITSTALKIGSGWDSVLSVNGTTVIDSTGLIPSTRISGTIFNTSADSGTSTLIQNDTLALSGGTNGIDTSLSGDTYTFNFDSTEVGTTTWGAGSAITWTFDASAGTDTTLLFGDNAITATTGLLTLTGDLAVNGGDLTSTATTFNFDIGNTGTLNFRDGTNTLVSIIDNGTTGTLSIPGSTSTITNTSGDITLDASSNIISFSGDDLSNIGTVNAGTGIFSSVLQVAHTAAAAYSRFGTATTGHGLSTGDDILISSDLELDGVLYLDGGNIANSAGTGTILFSSTPTTTSNTLSASSWLIENTANVGQAALMVNQTKAGDLFTASSSGTPKFTIHNDGAITLATDISSTSNTQEGTIFYDNNSIGSSSTDHLFLRGSDAAWHRLALDMTKYSTNNASVSNDSYIEIAHNQATNDLSLTGWVYDTVSSLWKNISEYSHTIKHALQNEFDDASSESFDIDTNGTLLNNLEAYWTLNESSATLTTAVSRYDSYGSNTLTDNPATTYTLSGTGKKSNAADFESTNSNFLEISDNNALSTGDIDFTISAWVKLESVGARREIVSKRNDSPVMEYDLYYYEGAGSDDYFSFSTYDSSGTLVCSVPSTAGVPAVDTWYFVVAWHNATADTCNIQVNNGAVDSAAETGVPSDTAANFRIGAHQTTETNFMDGLIDEVGFWKKTLSTQEKTDLYNSGNGNSYTTHGNLVRTQTALTSIALQPAIDVGTGADGSITVSTNTDINVTSLISGRSCPDGGDAVNYSVTALTSNTATLSTTPSTGCLAAGDEILLINLQGTNSAVTNVGNYETLRISSISTNTITFTTSKTKYYGDNATDDTNIGTSTSNQRVMLQRVPNYTNVNVNTSINFYPTAWNGTKGGVIFFRATGTVSSVGNIHANAKGYRGEPGVIGGPGNGGEAFCGAGGVPSNGNGAAGAGGNGAETGGTGYCGGGGGGGSSATSGGIGSSTSGGAGAGGGNLGPGGGGGGYGTGGAGGYSQAGQAGSGSTNSSGNGINGGSSRGGGGGGGGTYGTADLSKLYFGSAGGVGGAYTSYTSGGGGDGGGIVAISANSISVSGTVKSNGENGGNYTGGIYGGGGGGAGGSVKLSGSTLTLGTNLVSTTGGSGGSGAWSGGTGGNGRTAIYYSSSYSGSASSPTPTYTLSGYNTYGLYHSPVINTPNAATYESLRWETPVVPYGKVEFQTRSGATLSPTDGTWEAWKPFVDGTNYVSLNTTDTYTDWQNAYTLNVADGDSTRNIDQFEDEDESTAGNTTKLTATGFETDTAATLATSITSYWPMNEYSATAGTQVTRSDVYSTNHLTDNRVATSYILSGTGKKSYAADLELSNGNFFEKTDNAELSTGDIDFTIAAWVNMESESAGTTQETIISKYDSAAVREYSLYYTGATADRFQFELFDSGGTSRCTVTANTFGAVTTATWYYVMAWHDATANTCNISINNGTADSAAETGVPADTAANLRLGANSTTEAAFFDGLIDEVGFWKKTLSTAEKTDLYNSGSANTYPTNNQYAQASISSTDISGYDYLTAWVRASQTGSTVKVGFGESAATEQEETINIDAANTWQKVYWDLSDIQSLQRGAVTKLRFTNLYSGANTISIDNVRAEKLLTNGNHAVVSSTPNDYFQYRIIFSTTNTSYQPQVENIYLVYNDGYKMIQTDSNTVRLYNYSGSTQNLRLDAVVFGADLAEWYTVNDESIGPGDLVAVTGELDENDVPILRKSSGINDPKLIGAISTKAGQSLGIEAPNRRLLALAGRIPVKIDPSSPAINSGDLLTSSNLPGYARKARYGDKTIGSALKSWSPNSGETTLLILVGNSRYVPDFLDIGNFVISKINDTIDNSYKLVDAAGEAIQSVGVFSKALIANIEAGIIKTTELIADNIKVNSKFISPIVETELISPLADNTDVTIKIGKIEKVSEATDSASISSFGELLIEDATGSAVASIDTQGNATFSGELYAENIHAKNLEEIEEQLRQVQEDQDLLSQAANWYQTSTESGTFDEVAISNLYVTDQAAINSLSVSTTLTMGTDLIFSSKVNENTNLLVNSIDTLTSPLSLQSLAMAPIEIMAGKVLISTNGDVTINANLFVAGKIESPEAKFEKLTTQNLIIANPEATQSGVVQGNEITTNSMIGSAVIPQGVSEMIINNINISDSTLIYVTPTSETLNNVLFVKGKEQGRFVVGFSNPLEIDVSFNWWVINTSSQNNNEENTQTN